MKTTTSLAMLFLSTACATSPAVVPAPIVDISQTNAEPASTAPAADVPKKSASPADFPQTSPRTTLESFLRAFDEKRWDVLVRFIPSRHQAAEPLTPEKLRAAWEGNMRDQMLRTIAAVRRALIDGSIEQDGTRAVLAYDGGTVLLVDEEGVWKIEDFN